MAHGAVLVTINPFLVCLLYWPLPSIHPSDFFENLFVLLVCVFFLAVLQIILHELILW